MTNLYKKATAVATTLLLSLFLLPACSDNEGGGPDIPDARFAKVVIALHPQGNSVPAYTKAKDNPVTDQENDTEYERHIKDWWIVVVDNKANSQVVHQVITNDPASKNPYPNSETEVQIELPIGETFTFYAFANLNDVASVMGDGAIYIKGLKGGETFEPGKAVALKPMDDYKEGTYIPMSSYGYEKTVSENTADNSVSIELIRLLGKVSWEITNGTGKEITVNKLSFTQFRTTGNIFLLPYDAAKGETTRNLLATDMQATYKPTFPNESTPGYTPRQPIGESSTLELAASGDTQTASGSFFANETDFIAANGEGTGLLINVSTDIRGEGQKELETDFDFIRRNDWLKIPILISNAEVTIKPSQKHMPIGGLPGELTFSPGTIIADQAIPLDHAGELTLTYTLEELNGTSNASEWELQYCPETYVSGNQYCSAQIEDNINKLILEPSRTDDTKGEIWDSLPWLDSNAWGYHLTQDGEKISGSFTVNIQELSSGTAKIKLTLVAKHKTDGNIVVLPYTLTLNYGNTATTRKGGNS